MRVHRVYIYMLLQQRQRVNKMMILAVVSEMNELYVCMCLSIVYIYTESVAG